MRWILLCLLASPRLFADVKIAVLHESELLGSEQKTLADLQKRLKARLSDASPAEAAAAKAALANAPVTVPSEWRDSELQVVLEVLPPIGKKPKRLSGGLGSLVLFRDGEAIFVERVDGNVETSLNAELLAKWIGSVLKAGKK